MLATVFGKPAWAARPFAHELNLCSITLLPWSQTTYTKPSCPTPILGFTPEPTVIGAVQFWALSCEQTSPGSWSVSSKLRHVEYTWSPPDAAFQRSAAMCSWSAKHSSDFGGLLWFLHTTAFDRHANVCPLSV